MRLQILGLTLALAAGAAYARPINETPKTIQCVEVSGRLIPAACQAHASRLEQRESICTCPDGGERVEVALCAEGQREPPDDEAFARARRDAIRSGSLIGAKIGDRPICVAPHGQR